MWRLVVRAVLVLRWRFGLALLGGAGLFAPAAEASSFVTIAPPKLKISSSFVVLGAESPRPVMQAAAPPPVPSALKRRSTLDAPPDYAWEPAPLQISASIVAFGAPAVEQTRVASIGLSEPEAKPEVERAAPPVPRSRSRHAALPKVIRAGVKGHAFPDYVAPQPTVAQASVPAPDAGPEPAPPDEPPHDQPPPGPTASPPPAAARDPERPALQ